MSKVKTKSDIGSKIFTMAVVSILVVTTVFFTFYFRMKEERSNYDEKSHVIIALNEIDNLMEDGTKARAAKEKINELMVLLNTKEAMAQDFDRKYFWIFYGLSILVILGTYLIIYIIILRPFRKLEEFAGEIAAGNLDVELKYERVHMFGQFTWAFDHMRQEIKRARQCEKEAVENNKTVIATLSHDIKTPIASIRAYSEALEANMDSSAQRRGRYIDVIMRKCDEVTKITNDMFLHSLHDLDKLIIKKEDIEIHKVIYETVQSMQGDKKDVLLNNIEECTLPGCDQERIAQVLENLINNARKYAPGEIQISGFRENRYTIVVKDTGKGIPDEDMPFIFDKFYRGKNIGEQSGAGLGLFIVKYIMEQMGGSVTIINHNDGMEVRLLFS